MKKWLKIGFSLCLLCTLLFTPLTVKAEGASISANSQVTVGKTIAVTITVDSSASTWLYQVSYSSNLSTSNSTIVEGYSFAGNSRTTTLIFTANSVGTANVSISGSYATDDNRKGNISGSVSFQVVAVSNSNQGNQGGNNSSTSRPIDTRSSNNSLISLAIDGAELSPAFDGATTSYEVNLPAKTTSVTISAEPSDSKASIKGTGTFDVEAGENSFDVICVAENGSEKTYTIKVMVDEAPLVYTTFKNKNLGVVRNIKNVSVPDGFAETTTTLEGQEVVAWKNETTGMTLLYLVDENDVASFYVYELGKGVLSAYAQLNFNQSLYIYSGIPDDLKTMAYMKRQDVTVFDISVEGFVYEDENIKGFSVVYLMGPDGEYRFYQYDENERTLQVFDQGILSEKGVLSLEKKATDATLIRNISLGVNVVLVILVIYLLVKKNKQRLESVPVADPSTQNFEKKEDSVKETVIQEDHSSKIKDEVKNQLNPEDTLILDESLGAFELGDGITTRNQEIKKGLGINKVAGILDIIGCILYITSALLALLKISMAEETTRLMSTLFLIFAVISVIVSILSLVSSKREDMKIVGPILGMSGHALYAIFSSLLGLGAMVLCLLGGIITMKDNKPS